jgi:pyridoxal phosphate enzyme (YggS family)
VDHILAALNQGINNFGENYAAELAEKAKSINANAVWHFIGPIQSNKTKTIASFAAWVHSVERIKIAERLNKHCFDLNKSINVLIQVNIDNEASKSGAQISDVHPLAKFIEEHCTNLKLRGLMFMPSLTKSANEKNESMKRIKQVIEAISSDFNKFDTFSFGTSHDYPIALKYGSNLIRVGENIFGKRE